MRLKFKLSTLVFILFISTTAYCNTEKTVDEIFVETINNLKMQTILDDINIVSPAVRNIVNTNGIVIYRDSENNIVSDVRLAYKELYNYALAVNRSKMIVTVFAYNKNMKRYNIPVVSFPVSCNKSRTPLGLHKTSHKYRWRELFGNHYGQYCTRYTSNMLFHSILYATPSNMNMETYTYNGLASMAQSGGCIRLRTKDAKWIFENVQQDAIVYVYDSEEECPFKRPMVDLIPSTQTWDPTDDSIINIDKEQS